MDLEKNFRASEAWLPILPESLPAPSRDRRTGLGELARELVTTLVFACLAGVAFAAGVLIVGWAVAS